MSIRRIRQAEMLSRSASDADLLRGGGGGGRHPASRPAMRKSASCPSVVAGLKFDASALLPALSPAGTARPKPATKETRPAVVHNKSALLLDMPVELGLEILQHLGHADLLRFRGTSRACRCVADGLLARTASARLAACREKLGACAAALEAVECDVLPGMVLNHRYLGALSSWNVDELRWMRNPGEEVRVVCRCLVALHRGHSAPNYLAEPNEGDAARFESWAAVRAAMGTPEFRRWIAALRSGAERLPPAAGAETAAGLPSSLARYAPLSESDLLSSGRVWATQIWQSTATGFDRMRAVSAVAHRALQFVSAAVHYISLRTSLVQARKLRDAARDDVCRFERFCDAVARWD